MNPPTKALHQRLVPNTVEMTLGACFLYPFYENNSFMSIFFYGERRHSCFISNNFLPNDNEMMISYVTHLASRNGFLNVQDFLTSFFYQPDKRKKMYSNDYLQNLEIFAMIADIMPAIELVEKTTILPAVWPLLPASMQDRHIRKIFGGDKHLGSEKVNLLSPNLLYCPKCMEEDGYLHRSHHLPGIYYCPKHGCHLKYMDNHTDAISPVSYDAQKHYQNFFIELLTKWIRTDYTTSRIALTKRVTELTEGPVYDYLSGILRNYGINDYPAKRLASSLGTYMPGVPLFILAMLLGTVFPDVPTFERYLIPQSSSEFFLQAKQMNFTILERTTYGIVRLRHEECGLSFYTTENSFTEGWLCPCCDSFLSDSEMFEQIVLFKGKRKYTPVRGYRSLREKISLRHSCGQTLETSATKYLYYGIECACTYTVPVSEATKAIEAKGSFRLIHYRGTDKKARILSLECGHEFDFHYTKFLQHPYCKICSPRCPDEERFIQEIKELTGDEYSLAGAYESRIKPASFLHKTCGKTFKMRPSHFLTGHRCPCCIKQYRKTEFEDLVRLYSCGRYVVSGYEGKDKAIILDTITGKTKTNTRTYIIQEMTRLTPSSDYPHERPDPLPPITAADKIAKRIKEAYPMPDSVITADNIDIPGLTRKQIGRIMGAQLTKTGFLEPAGHGTYTYKQLYTKTNERKL